MVQCGVCLAELYLHCFWRPSKNFRCFTHSSLSLQLMFFFKCWCKSSRDKKLIKIHHCYPNPWCKKYFFFVFHYSTCKRCNYYKNLIPKIEVLYIDFIECSQITYHTYRYCICFVYCHHNLILPPVKMPSTLLLCITVTQNKAQVITENN